MLVTQDLLAEIVSLRALLEEAQAANLRKGARITTLEKLIAAPDTDGVAQTPAVPRLIQGGLPTEATITYVVVSKSADDLPLYR